MTNYKKLTNIKLARIYLGNQLFEGRLSLFIGAGISQSIGFPNWEKLLHLCCKEAHIKGAKKKKILNQNDYYNAGQKIEQICKKNKIKYKNVVKNSLYHGITYDKKTICSLPLIGILSLLIGCERGKVRQIVSLNFDDSLEWFCKNHGIGVQPVGDIPCDLNNDVIVYHSHGYLPKKIGTPSEKFIFSRNMAEKRLGEQGEKWRSLLIQILTSKTCIFYGLSMNTAKDWIVSSILNSAAGSGDHPLGFWIFKEPLENGDVDRLLQYNIVPLQFPNHDKSAEFLLSISKEALQIRECCVA